MHEKVDALWTVETLAAACGMSRSGFALRFKELVGETPLEYLTSWRVQKAAALLQKGDRKLIDVAKSVGYDSDAAFSKAFKRVVSVTPRDFRRRPQDALRRVPPRLSRPPSPNSNTIPAEDGLPAFYRSSSDSDRSREVSRRVIDE
jgi:AraC-like DNA-binding protein